jgi:hypothetical protein
MRRSQHGCVQGAGLDTKVVGVGSAAAQQGMVFQAQQALAYEGRVAWCLGLGCLQLCLLVPTAGTSDLWRQVSARAPKCTNKKVWTSSRESENHPNRLVTFTTPLVGAQTAEPR